MLKMLPLSYLYDISERQVEILANDSLSIGFFLRSGADEIASDHSTSTLLFNNRLSSNSGTKAYEELFDQLLSIAHTRGVNFGRLQLVDSVHLAADVNAGRTDKDRITAKAPEIRMPNGEAKKWHGSARCRYVGFVRHAIQSYLSFMGLNLKRLLKLLTGFSFRGEAGAYALAPCLVS